MSRHPTAVIAAEAWIPDSVEVGPFSIVHAGVAISHGSRIGAFCEIGKPVEVGSPGELVIGSDALIRSHSVIYGASTFGPRLETGHHVTIREHTDAGVNLRVGTQTDIQGDCNLGDYVRLHGGVQIGKESVIDSFAWIFPGVVLTNDPFPPSDGLLRGVRIGEYSVIATAATVLPGVTVGKHAVVAAGSLVKGDVPPGMLVSGSPARIICPANKILLPEGKGPAYPWPRHFRRGYPDDVLSRWDS